MKRLSLLLISALILASGFISCATKSSLTENTAVQIDPYSVEFEPVEKISISEYKKIAIANSSSNAKITAGETYDFEIGPVKSAFIVVYAKTYDKGNWNIIQNDGSNKFYKTITIPADAISVLIAKSQTGYSINGDSEIIKTIPVNKNPKNKDCIEYKDGVSRIRISAPHINPLPGDVYAGQFCQFDIGPIPSKYCIISMKYGKKKYEWLVLENDGSGYFSTFQIIPKDIKEITIAFSDVDNQYYGSALHVKTKKSANPYKYEDDPNLAALRKYKTKKPDKRIIEYMESIDARKLCKSDPDGVISMTIDYINSIQKDDYEKVKLVHDAVWYLVSYDSDSLAQGIDLPQDYKSVLNRGMSVCAGFSNVFSQFCKVANIHEFGVSGYARGTGKFNKSWSPSDNPKESNHAWNIIKIYDYWYLIDVTWDSGHTKSGRRDDYYSNAYIFVDPAEMIYSHFPLNSDFQLIDPPYTPKEFSKLPFITPM